MLLVGRLALGLAACVAMAAGADIDKTTLAWMQTALDRWATACQQYLKIVPQPLPWVIFFDDRHAWHLNPEKSWLPTSKQLSSVVKFAGRKYHLIQVDHRAERLWVPDRDPLPIKPGGATMPYGPGNRKVFFELALPSVWQKDNGSVPSHDLDELILGFALHELTHTRQLADVAGRIEAMQSRHILPESVNDNLIENTFSQNADYKKAWEEEFDQLSRAILADDVGITRRAIAELLTISGRRKARFFVGEYQGWSEVEDIFLVMEGMGMWVHYRMARDHAPRDEDWRRTATTLGERGDTWSQLEGLGLFLLIDRLIPGWQGRFLSPNFPSPFAVLAEVVKANR